LEKTIESLVDREKNLDALVTKTEGLQQSSMDFRKKAGQVRNNMWWKDAKMKLVLGVLLAIILLIVI
ncbi:synaptobrevin, partial [Chytriomyces sp. MP71]